jgi:hypothetical protein
MAADMGETLRKKRKHIEDCDDAFIGAVKALKKEDISTTQSSTIMMVLHFPNPGWQLLE